MECVRKNSGMTVPLVQCWRYLSASLTCPSLIRWNGFSCYLIPFLRTIFTLLSLISMLMGVSAQASTRYESFKSTQTTYSVDGAGSYPSIAAAAQALIQSGTGSPGTEYTTSYYTKSIYTVCGGFSVPQGSRYIYNTCNGVTSLYLFWMNKSNFNEHWSKFTIQASPSVYCNSGDSLSLDGTSCLHLDVPDPTVGKPDCGDGQLVNEHPLNVGNGYKYWTETIYQTGNASTGSYVLSYTSRQANDVYSPISQVGINWVSNLDRKLLSTADSTSTTGPSGVFAQRQNGELVGFTFSNGVYVSAANVNHTLIRQVNGSGGTTGWILVGGDDQGAETYDAGGNLLSITEKDGKITSLNYDSLHRISYISDPYGRQLAFVYDDQGRVNSITQPDGGSVVFGYDAISNLSSIRWPDGKIRTFHYENADFRNNLTGITDENNSRYSTYDYDAQGRVVRESLAGGSSAANLSFNANSTMVTDSLGTVRTFNFQTVNGVPKLISSTQPSGSGCTASVNAQSYDPHGNIASRTDFNGNTTIYTYDSARNLETQRVEASGKPESRTINTNWHSYWRLPTKVAEPLKITTYVYNGDSYSGSVVTCAPVGATVPSSTGGTRPIGVLCKKIEQATTDANGILGFSATTTGTPRIWSWAYNIRGQTLSVDGPRPDSDVFDLTQYNYYGDTTTTHTVGDLDVTTNAKYQYTEVTAYDKNGRPATIKDRNNILHTLTYWPRGWLHTYSVDGQTTSYDYDAVGQLTTVTRPDGSKTNFGYDGAHRLNSVSDLKGNTVSFTRDGLGNVTQTIWTNPDGSIAKTQSRVYDALGRLQNAVETREAVNFTITYGYDPNGNPTSIRDPKGNITTRIYDALNRPVQVLDAKNGVTVLAYDGRDHLTSFKAPNNVTTSFTMDGLGNVRSETSSDRGSSYSTYDISGNLITFVDSRGVTERITYDALNRPLTVKYPIAGEDITRTWDGGPTCGFKTGRLCQIVDATGTTTLTYDARGNLVGETWKPTSGGTFTTQTTFDGADHPITLVTPTGKVLTLQRDVTGQVNQVSAAVSSNPQVNLVSGIQQNALGQVTAQIYGNGVTETRNFNTDGSPRAQTDTVPSSGGGGDADVPTLPEWGMILLGSLLLFIGYRQHWGGPAPRGGRGNFSLLALCAIALLLQSLVLPGQALADEILTYDANGNVQTRTLPGGTTTYGYDELNRLNSEAGPAKTQSISYDPNDNRLSDGTGSKTYTANTDRIVTENGNSISLDASGNVTAARGYVYTWNQAGQLKTVSQGATLLATYLYDYKGRRRVKTTTTAAPQGAGTVLYHYDLNDHLLAETTAGGSPLYTYVWRDDVPVSIIQHGTTEMALYLEVDHLNTPIAARDQTGKVVWVWESDAFGSSVPNEDPDGDGTKVTINLRFPGQYFDKESELHYNYKRYYDPKLGRYMSTDPIGLAGGGNLYAYVNGNPLKYSDPRGLDNPGQGPYDPPSNTPSSNSGVTANCTATSTSGAGYSNGKKVCEYACTPSGGGQSTVVQGGCNSIGGGDVCYGVSIQTTSNSTGQMVDLPENPERFKVNTDSLVDRYIKYDSAFLDRVQRALKH